MSTARRKSGATRQHHRHLHDELQRAADDRSPRKRHGKARQRQVGAVDDERGDHRGVPHHRRGVRQQEPVMAVEHAQAPRGKDEQPGAGKQHADDLNRERALLARESRSDDRDQRRRGEDSGEHDGGHDERKERGDCAGDPVGFAPLAARDERGVDGNERRRQRALAEQILEEVGNPERGVERVGRVGLQPEVVRENPQPDEARQAAAQDAHRDQKRGAAGGDGLVTLLVHGLARGLRSGWTTVRLSTSSSGPLRLTTRSRRSAWCCDSPLSQRLRLARLRRACRSISSSDSS